MCPIILNFARSIGLHKIVLYCSVSTSGIYCIKLFLFCCPDVPTFLWFGCFGKRRGGKADSQVNSQNILKLIILYANEECLSADLSSHSQMAVKTRFAGELVV